MFLELVAWDQTNENQRGFLPDATNISVGFTLNSPSALTFDYPKNGVNTSWLIDTDMPLVIIRINGVEPKDGRFVIRKFNIDDSSEEPMYQFECWGYMTELIDSLVYPRNYPDHTDPWWKLNSPGTPGDIMNQLINDAKARGGLSKLTKTFNGSQTSTGAGWTDNNLDPKYPPSMTLLDVLSRLVQNDHCDCRMDKYELIMRNADSIGTDWATGGTQKMLWYGRDVADASERTLDRTGVAGVVLAMNSKDRIRVSTDGPTNNLYGRRERFVSAGNAETGAETQTTADRSLNKMKKINYSRTLNWVDSHEASQLIPYEDYDIGDYLWLDASPDASTGRERIKVVGYTIEVREDGTCAGNVTLGNIKVRKEQTVASSINQLQSGSTITAPGGLDDTPPNAPTGLSLTADILDADKDGKVEAYVWASWTAPDHNTDGTVCGDLKGYDVDWRYTGTTNWTSQFALQNNVVIPGLRTDVGVDVRVRAYDTSGNRSAWTATGSVQSAKDVTAPNVPSTPTVAAYLGQLKVTWNGLDNGGAAMPLDFSYVEIHASTSALPGSPATSTIVGTLKAKGTFPITDLTYGTTYNVKLVAVDRSGNRSAGSANATGVPEKLVNIDIANDAVERLQIKDGEIVTAKIGDLAVNDAKIANLDGGKINALSVNSTKFTTGVMMSNLLQNPAFEQMPSGVSSPGTYGTSTPVPGWTFSRIPGDTTSSYGVEYLTGVVPRSGASKAVLGCKASQAGSQTYSDVVHGLQGNTYTIGAYIAGTATAKFTMKVETSPTGTGSWTVQDLGFNDYAPMSTSLTTADKVMAKVTLPAGSDYLRVYMKNAATTVDTTVLVDDVWVVQEGFGATELTAAGLRMWDSGGEEAVSLLGQPYGGGSFLQIRDNGDVLAQIGADGISTFQSVETGQLVINGATLDEILDLGPRGVVALGQRGSDSTLVGTAETKYLELQVSLRAGRTYAFHTSNFLCANPGADQACDLIIRYTNDGTAVGTGSATFCTDRVTKEGPAGTGGRPRAKLHRMFRIAADSTNLDHRFLLTYGGSAANTAQILGSVEPVSMWVEDIGPWVEDIGIDRGTDTTSTTWKTYTKTYDCTWSRVYDGSGSNLTAYGQDVWLQGYLSGVYGNEKSCLGFANVRSDIDSTDVTVTKVEIYLYATDWYKSTGGTAVFGKHGTLSDPGNGAAYSTVTGKSTDLKEVANWKPGVGKWVELPDSSFPYSEWKSGTIRGIIMGPGPTNSTLYYGGGYGANGSASAKQPSLRITYKKKV